MLKRILFIWMLAAIIEPQAARAGPVDSTGTVPAPNPVASSVAPTQRAGVLTRGDVLYAIGTTAALIALAPQDVWLTSESDESRSRSGRALTRVAEPLGNAVVVLPVLAAGWLAEHAAGRSIAAGFFGRMAVSVGAAGAGALLLKEVVGRPRPSESLHDSDDLMPFSGRSSFPSGHATVAFALATAINQESSSRWTPWVTYPTALLVGWSRVYNHFHWTSDVVAGAALGIWTARKVDLTLRRGAGFRAINLECRTIGGAPGIAVTLGNR